MSLVMPAMMDGSPAPRIWFSGVNQFQHNDVLLPWAGSDRRPAINSLSEIVHAGSSREVVAICTTMQHHDQTCLTTA